MPMCDYSFFEIILWHGCFLVRLMYIFKTPKNTSRELLLKFAFDPFHANVIFLQPLKISCRSIKVELQRKVGSYKHLLSVHYGQISSILFS